MLVQVQRFHQLSAELWQVGLPDPSQKLLGSIGLARQLLQCVVCPSKVSFGEAELRESDLHAQLSAPFVVLYMQLSAV